MERPKLLLADDSLTIQRVVNLTFADEGIDVITVGDGDAALREIANSHPDIVLADVHMPGPSGYEICSLLRGIEETARIPVILLVGSFEQFDPEEAERAGADAFVTKPFQSIRQLVDQVRELLSRDNAVQAAEDTPVEAETAAVPPEVDTSDIESLYQSSFAETVEMPAETGSAYTADRLDDEIIETSYAADQPNEQVETGTPASNGEMYRDEQVYEGEQFAEPGLEVTEVEQRSGSPSYDETLQMDSPPVATGPSTTEESIHTAPTEEFRREPRDPFATTADAFEFDEIDLLNLTPGNATQEVAFTTPTDAAIQGSNKQVVSLSPELLDVIVQKVVERLSEKY